MSERTPGEAVPVCAKNGAPQPLSKDFEFPGTMVYQDSSTLDYFTIGGKPLAKSLLPIFGGKEQVFIGFSTNGKWLAFAPRISKASSAASELAQLKTPALVLVSSTGQRIEYPLGVDVRTYKTRMGITWAADEFTSILPQPGSYWINDTLLSLLLWYMDPADSLSTGYFVPRILDVSSGKWLDEPIDTLDGRLSDGQVRFAPDMSRVLYERRSDKGTTGLVLRDIESGVSAWEVKDFVDINYAVIQWAPDSSNVLLYRSAYDPVENQMLLISRDGSVSEIPNAGWVSEGSRIGTLAWSNDSREIAFDVATGSSYSLYVYDVFSRQYVWQCPMVDYKQASPALTWSPDDSYIALAYSSLDEPKALRLLHVSTGEILELGNVATSVDWSEAWPLEWVTDK